MKYTTPILATTLLLMACKGSKSLLSTIQVNNVTRIEAALSHDSMSGRQALTPSIDKAANFIAAEMKETGLQVFNGNGNYLQEFTMKKPSLAKAEGSIDGQTIDAANVIAISTQEKLAITNIDGYKLVSIKKGDNFRTAVRPLIGTKENTIVLVDTIFAASFKTLRRYQNAMFDKPNNLLFVLSSTQSPSTFSFNIEQKIELQKLANVVGYLPGKSKPDEYVLFSGHYDHLGIGKPDSKGDSIYNGANDDASGVTAMLTLANYYKKANNNERSLMFVAFTAEEVGGFGATYFSEHIDATKIAAMFNIEMIGTDSKWGKNSAYITGFEKTDFGAILQKNVTGTQFAFYPDPYPAQQLFYRSDNATLARKGVPAHTISTSKMDNEPHYHKASDEISTLDMNNMSEVIKAIALGAASIVKGTDTPTRVKAEDVNR